MQQFCGCINWNPFGILMVGWAAWCCATCFCQQARSSQRNECCWDHWQAWITLPAPATLVSNQWLSASVHLHLGKLLLWIYIEMQSGLGVNPLVLTLFLLTGTSRALVPQLVRVCTRAWTGCLATLLARYILIHSVTIVLLCDQSGDNSYIWPFFYATNKSIACLKFQLWLYRLNTFPLVFLSVGLRPGFGYQLRTD
jgi:hypothetical protein